jgi:cyclic-di-AMP phosphodiesterase PgpH
VSKQRSGQWDFRRALRKLPFFDEAKVTEALSSSGWAWALLWTLTLTFCAGYLAIEASTRERYAVNQLQLDPIYARAEFDTINEEQTKKNKADAADAEFPAYRPNPAFFQKIRQQIDSLIKIAGNSSISSVNQLPTDGRLITSDTSLAGLRAFIINGQPTPDFNGRVDQFISDLSSNMAILPDEQTIIEKDKQSPAGILLVNPDLPAPVELLDSYIVSTAKPEETRSLVTLAADKSFPKSFRSTFVEIVMREADKPSYTFDKDLTFQRKAKRAADVPMVKTVFREHDNLVPAGKILEPRDIKVLHLEQAAYNAVISRQHPWANILQHTGRIGVVALLALFLWLYILAVNPRVGQNKMRGLALTGLLVSTLAFITFSSVSFPPRLLYLTAIFPTLLCAIILAIAYQRRFAFAVATLNALLVTCVMDLGVSYAVVALTGVGVSVGLLKSVNTRSKLVLTGLAAGLAMAVAVIVTSLAAHPFLFDEQWPYLRTDALRVLGTGIATGLLIQGLLPAIEFLFKVTTQLTLKELNDASLPLLRRLAQEAPATYQHSLRIADMAEAAATAIGSDALLCRVGAMYHDIGKLSKPEYFGENLAGGPNPHDSISPSVSAAIILAHVTDGMEMAREYSIPTVIRHFIESHHGTTYVEYFYITAQKAAAANNTPEPDPSIYRYSGPIPQSREAAILMICDGIEASARALPDPTPQRFEALVADMIQKRLTQGQFDDCGITLQDLKKVQAAIVSTLCAMYHKRISYPALTPTPQSKALE